MLHGTSRIHVLETLRAAGGPLPITDLATRVGLHPNTVRWHLDQLVQAGWVTHRTESTSNPGRPHMLYTARSDTPCCGGENAGYRLLADILVSYLARTDPNPASWAADAGRAWGRYLTEKPAPFARLSPAEVTARVVELLENLGFAPEPDQGAGLVTLHACPFREVAEAHPEVACAVHLGLMQGALAELGAPAEATWLEPFVTPRRCHAHLDTRAEEVSTHG
ncbi:putative SufR family transcriptional regulator [Blastococcus saxobsidens DD2] [Mycobacterium shimoidei]|uniref:Putative SufR family transcriptional regulator [Blastococcus saxobsidens DD2] n=1 Tax=Mycobacterium shimoidei TaxID=29313 RepID=A0A375YY72_MYCSH|nr:putative SufR family transcriptional regulator [Blastococcus saxobsidens DD2] [Mycobacterium shimoidei]